MYLSRSTPTSGRTGPPRTSAARRVIPAHAGIQANVDPGLRRGFWPYVFGPTDGPRPKRWGLFRIRCGSSRGPVASRRETRREVGDVFWDATDSNWQRAPGPGLRRQCLLWEESSSTTWSQPTVAWALPSKKSTLPRVPTTWSPTLWNRTLSRRLLRIRTFRNRSRTTLCP